MAKEKVKKSTAKEKAAAKKGAGNGKPKAAAASEAGGTYGVHDLSKILDVKPASTRIKLRAQGIPKVGKEYIWTTKAELLKVARQLGA